jgi:hypothetical protein
MEKSSVDLKELTGYSLALVKAIFAHPPFI